MAETQLHEQAIFEIARKIESCDARRSYLQQACGASAELKVRIADLLRAYDEGSSFLEVPPPGLDTSAHMSWITTSIDPLIAERPGTIIGPYKLLEQIAEGGMGIVYMAEQLEPVERRVALKIIKPGLDTRQVIARFQAEWQALAMMDHPNIAKMYDAGTTGEGIRGWGLGTRKADEGASPQNASPQPQVPSPYIGRPFFVMELVKGIPITNYCDQRRLSPQQRMELFIQVCQAVQHAHQKGIIHRDLKPSNVLVAQYDDRPVPKIIDFGVAKATGQRLTEQTVFTHFGQIIGTAEYMSPEQAQFNQLDIDTRSDVYSLGVLLYELLSGHTPFDQERLRTAPLDDMLRIVREEEPPRPSTRLCTSDELPTIAANRRIEPQRLGRLVRGELDWIVMKALDKDRARRYQSASSFAADVQSYLNNEPVRACPPSTTYRFRKFARRNKAVLFTTSFVAAALLLGTAVATWQAIRATRESAAKAAALTEKDAALVTAREAVDQMLFRVGSDRLNNVPLAHPLRQSLLSDALQFYEALLLQSEDDPTLRDQAADVLNAMGGIQRELGRYDDARRSFEREIELLRNLAILHAEVPSYAEKHAASEEDLAYTWQVTPLGSNAEHVESHYRAALAIYADLERRWPDRPQPVAYCLRHLAETASALGELAKAQQLWRESIEKGERFLEREPGATAARSQVCWACIDLWQSINASSESRISDLEQIIQIGAKHGAILLEQNPHAPFVRDVVASLNLRLAMVYCRTGRVDEAVALFKKTVHDIDSLCADCPWNAQYWATARYIHSESLRSLDAVGRRDDAKTLARQMYEWVQNTAPRLPKDLLPQLELLQCQFQVAKCLQSLGQSREAGDLARSAMELHRQFENRPPNTLEDRTVLAQARLLFPVELLPAADTAQAASENLLPALQELTSNPHAFSTAAHLLIERAYQARENYKLMAALALSTSVADAAQGSPLLVESRIEALDEVMHNQWRLGQLDHAEATSSEVLTLASEESPLHWVEFSIYGRLAEIALARGRFDEAESWARKSIDSIDHVGNRNTDTAFVYVLLARALRGQDKSIDAIAALERAWKQCEAQNVRDDAGLTYYEWLATARETTDSSIRENTARSVLAYLSSSDETALDGLHLSWRAMAHGELKAWDAANQDWTLAFEQGFGDIKTSCFLALAQLHRGDEQNYRRVCAQMVNELGATTDEDSRFRFAWACAHGPLALDDLKVPLELASKLVEENPDCAAYQCTLGALLYRAGRYDEAAKRLRQATDAFVVNSSDQFSTVYPKLLMAMVQWKLGDDTESRELFAEVKAHYDDAVNSASSWNRRATLELFRREVEGLISSVPSKPQGNLLVETSSDGSNAIPTIQHAADGKPEQEIEKRLK